MFFAYYCCFLVSSSYSNAFSLFGFHFSSLVFFLLPRNLECYSFLLLLAFCPFRLFFFLSSFFFFFFPFLFLFSLFLGLLLSIPLLHSFHPNLSTLPYVLFAPLYKEIIINERNLFHLPYTKAESSSIIILESIENEKESNSLTLKFWTRTSCALSV